MGLIDELLLDGLFDGLGPSTSRGSLILAMLFGIGIAGASGWCLVRGIDPLHGPEWAFNVLLVSVVGAPIALFFGVVFAMREPEGRGFAILAASVNAAAFLTAIAAVVRN